MIPFFPSFFAKQAHFNAPKVSITKPHHFLKDTKRDDVSNFPAPFVFGTLVLQRAQGKDSS
jgi:hypothetical protein